MNYKIPESCQVKELNNIYLKCFGYKSDGVFVDVGAYDGITYSNTWGLADAGWSGICYEPLFFNQCRENHIGHNVIIVPSCVGNYEGYAEIAVAGAVSTINEGYLNSEYWKGDYQNAQKISVPIIMLDESLLDNGIKPFFDVLSLDVEGGETDALLGFDLYYWQPKMAIVEVQELHPAKELTLQAHFINEYFKNCGYEKIYCDEINNIYVRRDIYDGRFSISNSNGI